MRYLPIVIPLLSALSTLAAAGSLSFRGGNKLTFAYSTDKPNQKNWVGVYHTTGGPDDEKMNVQSLRWKYVTEKEGLVEIDAPVRASGQFKAYFLAEDGYKHLAKPIEFNVKSDSDPSQVRVMSFNLWKGGSNVDDYHEKQIKFITESGADIIGLQEAEGHHAKRLGEALGWNFQQSDKEDTAAIISRHPIVKRHSKVMHRSQGVTINVNTSASEQAINFWSIHTTADHYGPYKFCFDGEENKDVIEGEAKGGRTKEIADVLKGTELQRKEKGSAFIMVGDFNAPSHLDYITSTRSNHCGAVFEWPVSKAVEDAGLEDSFRVAHPDPFKDPGNTWSPIEKINPDKQEDEPQDRIDFIYHNKGSLNVLDSVTKLIGNPKHKPDVKGNRWTSDHLALMTTYLFD